ncbi:hypothetical protein C3747_27g322 [Trypanosoma cruzi]|uniref:Reverse transcriptase domain-containing protein n=1 Tax=Trypanosoma cruzi TaxID=5693 RepID=A0A2V2X540_TRYCR|nr:hypothetical protein C3747_27g322 [Trypanosoma cruzi]
MRPASATGKSACSSFCAVSRAIPPYAAAARCTPLVPGGWEMDRPFPPYVLDVAIRNSLLGSAPGPDDMLNEFLHRLVPVARGTIRTMIHNSFANGSLPGSWKMGDAIPIPKPGKDPCRPESYRPITLFSVLLKLAEGMIHRRLSALLPHHPRQFRICTSAFYVGRGGTCYRQITRGLNEFGIVEHERPGDDAPTRRPRRHRLWSRLIFRLRSTPLTMGSYSACLTDFRALASNQTLAAQPPAGPLCWGMHS